MAVPDQDHRSRHPTCPASRCQVRAMEQHRRGSILRGQFSRVGMPRRHRSPMSLACREHAALHPRRHLSGRSVSHPSQAGRLCQATLLRLQHTAPQSVLNIQSGSICCRSRRSRCAPQVEIQLRALNSPGKQVNALSSPRHTIVLTVPCQQWVPNGIVVRTLSSLPLSRVDNFHQHLIFDTEIMRRTSQCVAANAQVLDCLRLARPYLADAQHVLKCAACRPREKQTPDNSARDTAAARSRSTHSTTTAVRH